MHQALAKSVQVRRPIETINSKMHKCPICFSNFDNICPNFVYSSPNGAIEIVLHKSYKGIGFYVYNKQSATITATLNAQVEPEDCTVSLPYTESFTGNALTLAFEIMNHTNYPAFEYHWTWGDIHAKHDDSVVYALPYAIGKSYKIIQGYNGAFSHFGDCKYSIDWEMEVGTPLHAARGGVVEAICDKYDEGGIEPKYHSKVNFVKIRHDDNTIGEYLHLKYKGVVVREGERVKTGQLIGYSGNTGFSSQPHLHFWVYRAKNGFERESIKIYYYTAEHDEAVIPKTGRYYTACKPKKLKKREKFPDKCTICGEILNCGECVNEMDRCNDRDMVIVRIHKNDQNSGRMDFYVTNLLERRIELTMYLPKLENMISNAKLPFRMIVEPLSGDVEMLSIQKANEGMPFKWEYRWNWSVL